MHKLEILIFIWCIALNTLFLTMKITKYGKRMFLLEAIFKLTSSISISYLIFKIYQTWV